MKINIKYFVVSAILLLFAVFAGNLFNRRHQKKKQSNPPTFVYEIVKADSQDKSLLLMTPYQINRWSDGQLVIMDKKGKICLQKTVRGAPSCFRAWDIHGKRYYSYIVEDRQAYHIPNISLATGYVLITDSTLKVIKKINLKSHGDIVVRRNENLDLHDFILLGENHYIALAVYEKVAKNIPAELKPDTNLLVAAPIIQEVKDDSVIWQWDATNYPELYFASNEENDFSKAGEKHDYLHINSIFIDPEDSNIVCSFRQSNQVVKINRKNGNILWKLGGNNSDFPISKEQQFLRQHHANYTSPEHTLLVFDNGDTTQRKKSRITEYKLDESNKRILEFESFDIPEQFSLFMGGVNKIKGSYFIAGGTGNYMLEVNPYTKEKIFEMHTNLALYRVYITDNIKGISKTFDQPCEKLERNAFEQFVGGKK